jgi:hypothetical protein
LNEKQRDMMAIDVQDETTPERSMDVKERNCDYCQDIA